jgi:hypothetical protein
MMRYLFPLLLAPLFSPALAIAADYAIKVEKAAPPKQAAEAISKEMGPSSIQLSRDGEAVCNVWFCKEVASIATPAQAKNGLTYRELKEGTLVGLIEIVKGGFTDYRKQKIPEGVYTMRLGFQPMDGDHMGTAPYNEFLLLAPADEDKKADAIDNTKALMELSGKTTKTGHPAVLLLFPAKPAATPELAKKKDLDNHWVINTQVDALVEKKPTALGISLTIVGQSQ